MANNPPDPTTVPLADLSREQVYRLLAADYLIALADLIRKGQVSGFDLAWDPRVEKPAGRVMLNAGYLKAPLELHIMKQIKDYEDSQANKIQVEDLTETHEKCEEENCISCNNPNKA